MFSCTAIRITLATTALAALAAPAAAQDFDIEDDSAAREAREYYEEGKKALDRENWRRAQRFLTLAADKDPKPLYRIALCESHYRSSNHLRPGAVACDLAAEAANGTAQEKTVRAWRDEVVGDYLDKTEPYLMKQVKGYVARHDYTAAEEALADFVAWRPKPTYLYVSCQVLEAQAKYDEAIASCKRAATGADAALKKKLTARIAEIEKKKAEVFTPEQEKHAAVLYKVVGSLDDFDPNSRYGPMDPTPFRPKARACLDAVAALEKSGVSPSREIRINLSTLATREEREKTADGRVRGWMYFAPLSKVKAFCAGKQSQMQ